MKKYLVYIKQAELFKVEVEAENEEQAEDKASQAFSNGDYTETGSLDVSVDSIEEIDDPKCEKCGLTQKAGSREATRDFVFDDVCIGCNKK